MNDIHVSKKTPMKLIAGLFTYSRCVGPFTECLFGCTSGDVGHTDVLDPFAAWWERDLGV